MAFLTGGANTLDDSYSIENSLRCNGTDSYLNFTLGTPTSQRIATFSAWGKFNGQKSGSNDTSFWSMGNDYGQAMNVVRTAGTPQIYLDDSDGKNISFNNGPNLRDPAAWYHFVVQIDTTQSTATNRMKWFINGTQLDNTTASHEVSPDQNYDIPGLASGQTMSISKRASSSSHYIDGYIAEMIYLDGSIAAPTEFGEVDDNGVWIPKKPTGLTFGNNGAWLEFKQTGTSANASGIGADTSGNGNHYTVNNLAAIDVTVDTPTNNFCTWNPLYKNSANPAYTPSSISEGNLKLTLQNDSAMLGTMGVSKGKWYWEYKLAENTADNQDYPVFGFATNSHTSSAGNMVGRGTSATLGGTPRGQLGSSRVNDAFDDPSLSANDIIGFYLDLDNETLILHKNGSDWMGSGATNGLDFSSASYSNTPDGFFYPFVQNNGQNITGDQANFGNPTFSISSSHADANGYGSFEHNPTLSSTNYYALCTKNLAEYG